MNSDAPIEAGRFDQTARLATITLLATLLLLAGGIAYSAVAKHNWLSWALSRSWLVTVAILIVALLTFFLFDMTRPKNVGWRRLRERFDEAFSETLDRKNFGTGRGQVGEYAYFGLRCFGSPSGLEINRIVAVLNRPLFIPWSAVAKIDTFPNLLTGRKEFETNMQAQIVLREWPDLTIEVPWLTEYRQLLPKSVKYRAIKLSKK